MSSLQEQYESVRYPYYVHPLTDPARTAAIAKVLGMNPVDPAAARVLEVGCASGSNLLAMAARMPGSQFVGIDFSKPDIDGAAAVVAEAGMTNVHFRHADLVAWEPGEEKFDYVVAHGFYSWVPDEVKDRLLKVISACLSPRGIAFVSYLTYPGSKQADALRYLLQLRTDPLAAAADKVKAAHATLDFLDRAWASVPKLPHSSFMREEAKRVREKEPHFLLHDDLELVRDPCYLLQFARRAAAHGLKYLGDSEFDSMLLLNLPPETARELASMGLDQSATEQVLDYITHRSMRSTLLVRGETELPGRLNPTGLRELCFGPKLQPVGEQKPGASEGRFATAEQLKVNLRSVPLVAFIRALASRTGALTPYAELLANAQRAAGRPFNEAEEARLCQDLLALYARRELDLSALAFAPTTDLPERPRLTPVNLALARQRAVVVPAVHGCIRLTPEQQACCLLLDGNHTRSQLGEMSAAMALNEKLEFFLRSLGRLGCLARN